MFVKYYATNYTIVLKNELKRDITFKNLIWFFFSQVNQVTYSPALISSPSFKVLAQIVINISSSQEKHNDRTDGQTNDPNPISEYARTSRKLGGIINYHLNNHPIWSNADQYQATIFYFQVYGRAHPMILALWKKIKFAFQYFFFFFILCPYPSHLGLKYCIFFTCISVRKLF